MTSPSVAQEARSTDADQRSLRHALGEAEAAEGPRLWKSRTCDALRGLTIGDVLALYPSLTEAGAEDAVALERRLGGTTVAA